MTLSADNDSDRLMEENKQLKKQCTDLLAVLYQILDQDENDFFDDNIKVVERQNIRRMLKQRFPLTHETLDIVNMRKQQQPTQEDNP